MKRSNLNLIQRATAPTPKIFRIFRNVGLALAAAGSVMTAVSQIAVEGE